MASITAAGVKPMDSCCFDLIILFIAPGLLLLAFTLLGTKHPLCYSSSPQKNSSVKSSALQFTFPTNQCLWQKASKIGNNYPCYLVDMPLCNPLPFRVAWMQNMTEVMECHFQGQVIERLLFCLGCSLLNNSPLQGDRLPGQEAAL